MICVLLACVPILVPAAIFRTDASKSIPWNGAASCNGAADLAAMPNTTLNLLSMWPSNNSPQPTYNSGTWSRAEDVALACKGDPMQVCDPDQLLGAEGASDVQNALDKFHKDIRVDCEGESIGFRLAIVVLSGLSHDRSADEHIKPFGNTLIHHFGLHMSPACPNGAVVLLLTSRRYVVFQASSTEGSCNRYITSDNIQAITDRMRYDFYDNKWSRGLKAGIEWSQYYVGNPIHYPIAASWGLCAVDALTFLLVLGACCLGSIIGVLVAKFGGCSDGIGGVGGVHYYGGGGGGGGGGF